MEYTLRLSLIRINYISGKFLISLTIHVLSTTYRSGQGVSVEISLRAQASYISREESIPLPDLRRKSEGPLLAENVDIHMSSNWSSRSTQFLMRLERNDRIHDSTVFFKTKASADLQQ